MRLVFVIPSSTSLFLILKKGFGFNNFHMSGRLACVRTEIADALV